jgi:hypothetical protein
VALNSPPNGSSTPNNWAILNATVTDADDDPMTVYFYANNNSNGLNASEGLVYIGENAANGTTLTYNLTALPIKPSEANLSLLSLMGLRIMLIAGMIRVYLKTPPSRFAYG